MMNCNDAIKPQTKVYGFLSEYAQQNRFSVMMNRMFQNIGADAMMIPMNIRADDFFFTISGLRKAQLNGVVIGTEYRHEAVALCESISSEAEACGFCDIITIAEGTLHGDVYMGRAMGALFQERKIRSLALYGSSSLAQSILYHVKCSGVKEVTLFSDRIESCRECIDGAGAALHGVSYDIERANEALIADFSAFDMAINVADEKRLFSDVVGAAVMVDFAQTGSPFSALKESEYLGYDDLLAFMNASAYTIFEGVSDEFE